MGRSEQVGMIRHEIVMLEAEIETWVEDILRLLDGLDDEPDVPDPPSEEFPTGLTWLHTDVSRWPVEGVLDRVEISPTSLSLFHTMAGQWPRMVIDGTAVEGNPWVIAQVGGTWYAATYEWLRPGQTRKAITAETIGPHTKRPPLETWRPKSGERVGFLVSTLARTSARSTRNARTTVKWVTWP